jgi:uncharacterized protein YraI
MRAAAAAARLRKRKVRFPLIFIMVYGGCRLPFFIRGRYFLRIEMKLIKALSVLLAALAAIPATTLAQQLASASGYVNLRAGPARDYPIIARLPAGIDISVIGCLSDYRWCDVIAGPDRGWVYAGNIVYPYQDANVPLLSYGPVIGIGIIAFDLDHYWHRHYRARPWYRQRQYWIDRQRPDFHHGGHRSVQVAPPVGFRTDRHRAQNHWPAPVPPVGQREPPRHVPVPALRPPPEQRAPPAVRPPPLVGPGAHEHPGQHPHARQHGNHGQGQPRDFAPPHQ